MATPTDPAVESTVQATTVVVVPAAEATAAAVAPATGGGGGDPAVEPTAETTAAVVPTAGATAAVVRAAEAPAEVAPATGGSGGDPAVEPTAETTTAVASTADATAAVVPTAAAPTEDAPAAGGSDGDPAIEPTADATAVVVPTADATAAVVPAADATVAVVPTAEASAEGAPVTGGIAGDAAVEPTADATTAVVPTAEATASAAPAAGGGAFDRAVEPTATATAAALQPTDATAVALLPTDATAAVALAAGGGDDGGGGTKGSVPSVLPASLWAWLAPHRVPPNDSAYTTFRPFINVTRHILGAELVDLYGVFLMGAPVMTTYVGLLGPSLGPSLRGAIPVVDAGLLPFTPALRRAAMAAASATSGCGYCTAHTVGVGSLLSGTYRGERRTGGAAPRFALRPLPQCAGGCGGGGTAEAAVIAYAAATATWPPTLTPGVVAAAAAALGGNTAAFGALQSSVAYTGFLNTAMALFEPPLEEPLAAWVTAVVSASPDLAGHPVEAKAAAAAAVAASASSKSTPLAKKGVVPVTPEPLVTAPRGTWTKAVDLMRLLPTLTRLSSATERLVMGGMPRDADGVTITVRAALGGHLPPILVAGVLPTGELRRAVAVAFVDHFGPSPPAAGKASAGDGGGGGGGGRHRRHWSQAVRVGLLARFADTAGNATLAAEAAALGAPLDLPAAAARAAAAAPRALAVAGRIMDAAAERTAGGLGADLEEVVGLPPGAVVEAVGLAGFIGYLQRLWVVFLGES